MKFINLDQSNTVNVSCAKVINFSYNKETKTALVIFSFTKDDGYHWTCDAENENRFNEIVLAIRKQLND